MSAVYPGLGMVAAAPKIGPTLAAHPYLCALVVLFFVGYLYRYPYRALTASFRNVRGPPPPNFFFGTALEIDNERTTGATMDRYMNEYGDTIQFDHLLGEKRLATRDITAIAQILNDDEGWVQPYDMVQIIRRAAGSGLVGSEGATHRRQQRVLAPAFSWGSIRDMNDIFADQSRELNAKLIRLFDHEQAKTTDGVLKLDMRKYIGQASLDMIGLAGFGYQFDAIAASDLGQQENEIVRTIHSMFTSVITVTPLALLQMIFPFFHVIPSSRDRTLDRGLELMRRMGREWIKEKKEAILLQNAGGIDKGLDVGKDLLSLIVKANMAHDLRDGQKLTEMEMVDQIPTFSTATSTAWALNVLAEHPDIQNRLRQELSAVTSDHPGFDELQALPYLEKFMREVFRLYGALPTTERQATRALTIPLGSPVIGRDGTMIDHLTIEKDDIVYLPLCLLNTSPDIWGPEAHEFNPDRFDDLTYPLKKVPGVYGGLTTMGYGHHHCIGWRFAIAEIKHLLFVLVRTFEFFVPPNRPPMVPQQRIFNHSIVLGEIEKGPQMPLLVRLL